MTEAKKEALVKAAKKLVDKGSSREDIILGVQELGFSKSEALKILEEVSPAERKKTAIREDGEKIIQALKNELPKAEKTFIPRLRKGGREKVKEIIAHSPLGGKIPLPGAEQYTPVANSKTYVPKLRSGGREKVKEIIAYSALDRKDAGRNLALQEEFIIQKLSKVEEKLEELEREILEKEAQKKGKK